jgi:hypothetical protein
MTKNLVWLSISLFCKKDHWHKLLKNGVGTFSKLSGDLILDQTIEFNYMSGENIRYSLLAYRSDAERLSSEASVFFRNFFLGANFTSDLKETPVEGFFMPYKTNSVRFGLYSFRKAVRSNGKGIEIHSQLSAVIVNALSEEMIDDEVILTLAFYLAIGVVKALSCDLKTIEDHTPLMPNDNYGVVLSEDMVEGKFLQNAELLGSIVNEVMSALDRPADARPAWLHSWISCCRSCAEAIACDPIEAKNQEYRYLIAGIYRHLGITYAMHLFLYFFLRQFPSGGTNNGHSPHSGTEFFKNTNGIYNGRSI